MTLYFDIHSLSLVRFGQLLRDADKRIVVDNDLTDLLDVPVCSDLNYEPLKYIENNNYFMCDVELIQTVIFITK